MQVSGDKTKLHIQLSFQEHPQIRRVGVSTGGFPGGKVDDGKKTLGMIGVYKNLDLPIQT